MATPSVPVPLGEPANAAELGDRTRIRVAAPHCGLAGLEMRVFSELGAVLPCRPWLQRAPRGDHAVVVFPGLAGTDGTTAPLRLYPQSLGYAVYGWEQDRNLGPHGGALRAAKD